MFLNDLTVWTTQAIVAYYTLGERKCIQLKGELKTKENYFPFSVQGHRLPSTESFPWAAFIFLLLAWLEYLVVPVTLKMQIHSVLKQCMNQLGVVEEKVPTTNCLISDFHQTNKIHDPSNFYYDQTSLKENINIPRVEFYWPFDTSSWITLLFSVNQATF